MVRTTSLSVCRAQRHRAALASAMARGFTLLEVVMTLVILGLVAATSSFFWVSVTGVVAGTDADLAAQAEARAVLERLSRELREVKLPSGTASYCFSTMASDRVVFAKPRDYTAALDKPCSGPSPAPSTANNDFVVTASLANRLLTLAYAGELSLPLNASNTLASDVSGFNLRYLDEGFAPGATSGTVRYVEITLTLQPTGARATTAQTVVALRSR